MIQTSIASGAQILRVTLSSDWWDLQQVWRETERLEDVQAQHSPCQAFAPKSQGDLLGPAPPASNSALVICLLLSTLIPFQDP